jgi:hypothetical protein
MSAAEKTIARSEISCIYSGRGLSPQWPRPGGGRKRYMIKRVLTLDNALNITPRISINDAADSGRLHNRTGQVS